MRNLILTLLMLTTLTTTHSTDRPNERPDTLGDGFTAERFEMGSDYSGEVHSTLVRLRPFVESERALLYIHGFNDYFFQSDMAHRFRDSGYNFYAVDLRRCGRSLTASQRPFEVRELSEYFEDIRAAVEAIHQDGAKDITLMGHSTGGLIAAYFVGTEQDTQINQVILNSPYLSQNVSWFLGKVAIPIVAAVGKCFPDIEVQNDTSTLYFESLHNDAQGEWSYDTRLKMRYSPPITAGWLRAIHTAQMSVQQGYNIETPILLMYSDKSLITDHWQAEVQQSDIVLNVRDIAKYGSKLSRNTTHAQIENGMHDLILSAPEVRENAYRAIFSWLDRQRRALQGGEISKIP
ncbi:MAG: alpha/beta hydrolase [Rikenellaceae bacterium]